MMIYLCPVCKSDNLDVVVEVWARLIQEPDNIQTITDECEDNSHEWTENSVMRCRDCRKHGIVDEFKTRMEVPELELISQSVHLPMQMDPDDSTPF